MYKVMLVEDEIPIRNIITRIIDWKAIGYDLVYQADNGQMALDYLNKDKVDLVITDISMPFMDGLDLCKHIRNQFPSITIIILSGHSEFDYARKAISLGVSNYLLKPVTKKSFSKTLMEIKGEMDSKYDAQKNLDFLRKQYYKSKNVIKNKFYMNLITGYTQANYLDQEDVLGLKVIADKYAVVSMVIEGEQLEEYGFWGKDRPLLDFAIYNLASEILESIGQDIIFFGPGNQICVILKFNESDTFESYNQCIACLETISEQTKNLFHMNLTAGLSDICDNIDQLCYAYEESCIALEYRVLEASEKVIVKSTMEKKSSFTLKKLEEQLNRLEYSIKVGDKGAIRKNITYIFSVINYEKVNINDFRTFLMQMGLTIFKTYNDICDNDEIEVFDYSIFSKAFEISDFVKIQEYFLNLCEDLSSKIIHFREDEDQNHIKRAISYIEENYKDPNLNLESMCKNLYISQGHFSRMFKKSVGINFVDYLTKERIDRAKYLLANTKKKMYEISSAIGYEDPNYFSYNFKKHTGKTPSVWRKGEGNIEEQ